MKSKSSNICLLISLMICIMALSQSTLRADPNIFLDSAGAFKKAIDNHIILGFNPDATDSTTQLIQQTLSKIYTSDSPTFGTTSVKAEFVGLAGLNSTVTSNTAQPVLLVGSTTIVKDPDPDYTNFILDLTLYINMVAPDIDSPGFDSVTVALIDANNYVKYWTWNHSALFLGPNRFHFNLSTLSNTDGSTSYFKDTLFDLTHVTMLDFSFEGKPVDSNGLTLKTPNILVPEPDAFASTGIGLVLGAGVFTANAFRSRRKK